MWQISGFCCYKPLASDNFTCDNFVIIFVSNNIFLTLYSFGWVIRTPWYKKWSGVLSNINAFQFSAPHPHLTTTIGLLQLSPMKRAMGKSYFLMFFALTFYLQKFLFNYYCIFISCMIHLFILFMTTAKAFFSLLVFVLYHQ